MSETQVSQVTGETGQRGHTHKRSPDEDKRGTSNTLLPLPVGERQLVTWAGQVSRHAGRKEERRRGEEERRTGGQEVRKGYKDT